MEKESHNEDISQTDVENVSQEKNFRINSISKNESEKKEQSIIDALLKNQVNGFFIRARVPG